MSQNFKKPYEISLWEDIYTYVVEIEENGERVKKEVTGVQGLTNATVIAEYYKEHKMFTIGSDTMNTPIRAMSPKLNPKINGSTELTFSMYSHYYDEELGELVNNPFIRQLVNERKIKVRYGALGASDTKWYDLVIKSINENSENKTYEYVARDLFINELSKSGFNLEFDTELMNNTGTVQELGERILEESDWKLKDSDTFYQTKEEPLYELKIGSSNTILAKDIMTEEKLSISGGQTIYAFYSSITNKEKRLQFLYRADGKYEVDSDGVVINAPYNSNYYLDNIEYNSSTGKPVFADTMIISDKYRGDKIVRSVITVFDNKIGKQVKVYKDNKTSKEYYGYVQAEYISPTYVKSYITNGEGFTNTAGWEPSDYIEVVSVPDVRDFENLEGFESESCLKIQGGRTISNSGIEDFKEEIYNFTKGEIYTFRISCGKERQAGAYAPKSLQPAGGTSFTVKIEDNNLVYFEGIGTFNAVDYDTQIDLVCKNNLTYEDFKNNKLRFSLTVGEGGTYYLQKVQFFKKIENNGSQFYPDGENFEAKIQNIYYYYDPSTDYDSLDNLTYLYKGYEPNPNYESQLSQTYEKRRSIKASESNRFNLIQDLCEIFECWPKFEIEHNNHTGAILVDENYRQKKFVSFHKYIGQDNDRGFRYGINLKNIKRDLQSDAIVSKLIVKNNSNEFAQDGFCSIARAYDNPSGENFIIDFGYYIQHEMLTLSRVTNDLYNPDINKSLGYITRLREINDLRDRYISEMSGLLGDLAKTSASCQSYKAAYESAEEAYEHQQRYLKQQTSYNFSTLQRAPAHPSNREEQNILEWKQNLKTQAIMKDIARLNSQVLYMRSRYMEQQAKLNYIQNRYDTLEEILTSEEPASNSGVRHLLWEKNQLNQAFYQKYSRFLQEGSWISEDYIDDNLYYWDAEATLITSAKPKITYNIEVLELSQIEGYENYVFALGDKTHIIDTEFFGWARSTEATSIRTPYREEIVVSELVIMLDEPDKNQIKVQNYKNQFEDLFQRMAATTQSVEYHTGEYKKVSNVIESNGTIKVTNLQNAITNNSLVISNVKDQSVVWNEQGITTTSLTSPGEVVRIVSGGIFLSQDGGETWSTGITGSGINASYITTGQLNTNVINIFNGAFPSFRWDNEGISAYSFKLDDNGQLQSQNNNQFIRIDQYGIYGIKNLANFNSAIKDEDGSIGIDKIKKNASFGLTWDGFFLKSDKREGYISISNDNDFQVFQDDIDIIKIGRLNDEIYGMQVKDPNGNKRVVLGKIDNSSYGLEVYNSGGQPVLSQDEAGNLWLRDKLSIGTENSKHNVQIGKLGIINSDVSIHPQDEQHNDNAVFSANEKFVVYEDGCVVAKEIYATGGKIGNMTIETLQESRYSVRIETDKGQVFTDEIQEIVLTAILFDGAEEVINTENFSYSWKQDGVLVGSTRTYTVNTNSIGANKSSQFTCEITMQDGNTISS